MSAIRAIADVSAREALLIALARGEAMQEPDKVAALLDAAGVLDALGCAYAVIGGVAVGVHSGVPRATQDVDLAIPTSADRAVVESALVAAGFRRVGTFAHSMNFRHPNGEPVQLAFDPQFDPMIERADALVVEQATVRIVTRDDLVAMKVRAAGDPTRRPSKRLRDQADVALLRGDVPDPDEGW